MTGPVGVDKGPWIVLSLVGVCPKVISLCLQINTGMYKILTTEDSEASNLDNISLINGFFNFVIILY